MRRPLLFQRFSETNNTGFGMSSSNQAKRLINKDGTFNVIRSGIPFLNRFNYFHNLIQMSWAQFNTMIVLFYFFINLFFAFLYYYLGVEHLGIKTQSENLGDFWEAFFFSCQTFTTVGYGRISPIGLPANILAAIESLSGLMTFALVTGLIYGRFSRPNTKLIYSPNILISPFKDGKALMFRLTNARKNQLIECQGKLLFSYVDAESNTRRFLNLNLEIDKIASLALSWTVVHPISGESPLQGLDPQDLIEMEAEFIFMISGFDDTYSQTVHGRHSFSASELVNQARFLPMFERSEDGNATLLKLDRVGAFELIN